MTLRVTQVRSAIGTKPKQRGTLRALGLGRIGRSNTLPDRPEIRGMIQRVPHLVLVEEQAEEPATEQTEQSAPLTDQVAQAAEEHDTASELDEDQ